jgi:hypothetical protein
MLEKLEVCDRSCAVMMTGSATGRSLPERLTRLAGNGLLTVRLVEASSDVVPTFWQLHSAPALCGRFFSEVSCALPLRFDLAALIPSRQVGP